MAVHSPAAPPRPTATKPRSKAAEPRPRLFDVEEYHRLGEMGFFGPEERLELLDGVIYEMAAILG